MFLYSHDIAGITLAHFGTGDIGMEFGMGNHAWYGVRKTLYIRYLWGMYDTVRYMLAFWGVLGSIKDLDMISHSWLNTKY